VLGGGVRATGLGRRWVARRVGVFWRGRRDTTERASRSMVKDYFRQVAKWTAEVADALGLCPRDRRGSSGHQALQPASGLERSIDDRDFGLAQSASAEVLRSRGHCWGHAHT